MNTDLWFTALLIVMIMGVLTWLVSLKIKDVSIVDSLWSLMFLGAGIAYLVYGSELGTRSILVFILVTVWALRLSIFLTIRNWGEDEDRRYRDIRANNEPFWIKSLFIVFGLQGLLAWFISVPLLSAISSNASINMLDIVACCLWLTGFMFETVADQQLHHFKKNPDNQGQVFDRGLWRYSRHPNYFGESLIWWAFYLLAVQHGPWWIIIAPALMTVLLLKVSGVSLMEQSISSRRPEYAAYIKKTNAFLPGMPRSSDSKINENKLEAS